MPPDFDAKEGTSVKISICGLMVLLSLSLSAAAQSSGAGPNSF
jgi:hypothetical protein